MWYRIKHLLTPPVFEDDKAKTNNAWLLHYSVLIIIASAILYPLTSALAGHFIAVEVRILAMIMIAISIGLYILMRFGRIQQTAIILGFVWWAIFLLGSYSFGGLHDTAITGFFFLIILTGSVAGRRSLLGFSSLTVLSLTGIYFAEQLEIITPKIDIPSNISDLILPVMLIGISTFILRITIDFLTNAHNQAQRNADQLEETNTKLLESRNALADRTQELEQRTRYLEATSAVARDVASELDPEILMRRIVILVNEQFSFYHTGLFLIEAGGEHAVLKAASSEGGQHMLARDHRLRVGTEGIVGFVASQGRSRVALDTGVDAVYFNNPDLPDTRSEAALPLRVRGQVIGVLDVQSTQSEAFNNDDITVLQTLADQIAVALQTAQLFQQVEQSLETQRKAYGEVSQEAWRKITEGRDHLGYRYLRGDVIPVDEQIVVDQPNLPEITLPVQIGEQTVGYITAHKSSSETEWTTSEVAIMETLSDQLGVALESARLYQDTQLRASREQLTGEVTTRIRETMDIETIIKTASEEIRKALDLPEVVIRLGEPSTNPKRGVTE